jgi:hypothetical protein
MEKYHFKSVLTFSPILILALNIFKLFSPHPTPSGNISLYLTNNAAFYNRTARIRYQYRETTSLSYQRCLINTTIEEAFKNRL